MDQGVDDWLRAQLADFVVPLPPLPPDVPAVERRAWRRSVGAAFLVRLHHDVRMARATNIAIVTRALVRRGAARGAELPSGRFRAIRSAVRAIFGLDEAPVRVDEREPESIAMHGAVSDLELAARAAELVDEPITWGKLVERNPLKPVAFVSLVLQRHLSAETRGGGGSGAAETAPQAQHRVEQMLRAMRDAAERAAGQGAPEAAELHAEYGAAVDDVVATVDAHGDASKRLPFVLRKLFGPVVWPAEGSRLRAWTEAAAGRAWGDPPSPWPKVWHRVRLREVPAETWTEGYTTTAESLPADVYLGIDAALLLSAAIPARETRLGPVEANTWGHGITNLDRKVEPKVAARARHVVDVLAAARLALDTAVSTEGVR